MKKGLLSGLVVVLAGLLTWLLLFWQPQNGHQVPATSSLGIAEAPKGGDFILDSYRGQIDTRSLRGQVLILYFGYTWCPDVCPTSLGFLSAALDQLSPEELQQVQALFISVDPERDSLDHLRSYGEYFHPNLLGITGTHEQLERVAAMYGAAYRHVKQESATDYVVDHSADLYLVDRQGQLRTTIRHGTQPGEILAAIRAALNNN
ncbi:SCO family protein [Sedimenticola selenatireducens]|uniref:SCO family protein n=1 Tax=Sedimenticola selenatireducens TaxID=191960 RepID=A0A2N6CVR0_9GAMM|nr:SCO family protein [Sedimenticola selenatireducens]PLX61313.1 MAG: SCO family protein [Sedimenticola selenatireducens]